MNLGENVASQNNFASEDAARFMHSPIGVSLKCRDEVSVQFGADSLYYVLARTGACHDYEVQASFVRCLAPSALCLDHGSLSSLLSPASISITQD
jgi:hypothetical protein